METTYKDVANYYDGLWAQIEKESLSGINSRHRVILNKLKKAGLKKDSTILEIGCGIGTLTNYLSKQIPNGKIVGVDISPESVDFAKKKYAGNKNTSFMVSDMTNFSYEGKFDIILFPDVLEHIPVEGHQNIFKTISGLVHENSIIAINLPHPNCLRWFKKNNPKALQIIDQDIETDVMLNHIYPFGFYLQTFETYALYFNVPDYQWMVFKRNKDFENVIQIEKPKVIFNGIILRLKNIFS